MREGKLHYMKQHAPTWFKEVHENFRNKSRKIDRLYISRSKASRRIVSNEKDIIKLVERYGFRIIYLEDLNVKDQISLFNNAKIIIAPHGAGIINFAYCSNPFRLLEIYPPNYLDSSFRILAQVLKCDYHYLISETKEISNIDP
jgi:capsular polysaccharide biosynthesis protein